MQAYNAEKYIRQSIESVLNQTEKNIELILVNNASTDLTGEICREYAEKDSRIKFQENELNTVLNPEYKANWIYPQGAYYAFVDSDDYLDKDFVKIMYGYAKENYADIVIGGTNWITVNGKCGKRNPMQIVATDMSILADCFEQLYGSLRTLWGKLYRTEFYNEHVQYAWDKPEELISGVDTFAVLRYLGKCKRLVAVNQALYNYRVHEKSLYYSNVSINRVVECDILYSEASELLKSWNRYDTHLFDFLQDVHLASIVDCMENIVRNEHAKIEDKLNVLQAISKNDIFCSYALLDKNEETTFMAMGACVDRAIGKNEVIDIINKDYFIDKIYRSISSKNEFGEADIFALFMSGICHVDNHNLWGLSRLLKNQVAIPKIYQWLFLEYKEQLMTLLQNIPEMHSLINERLRDNDQLMLLKSKLEICINSGLMEEAISIMLEVANINPLDREGLYYKLIIAWQLQEVDVALNTAEVISVFWHDDVDLVALCGDLYGAVGCYERAYNLYKHALISSVDESFKQDIQQRINRLEKGDI